MLMNLLLLSIGLWAVATGIKVCEQVYGIALILSGLIVLVWGLTLSPLWLQILVEVGLIALGQFFYKLYVKEFLRNRRTYTKRLSNCPQ